MFVITFDDPSQFKSVVETVGALISETTIKIDKDEGLLITAMDLSHICLVHLHIFPKDCNKFEADETVEFGVNFEDLKKIIKRCNVKDTLTLSFNPEEKRLKIGMKNPKKPKTRIMNLGLVDIEQEEINLDSLLAMEFDNECRLDTGIIDEAIKDAEIFSEVLNFSIIDKKLQLFTTGNVGDMNNTIDKEGIDDATFTANSDNMYAIGFLKKIFKASVLNSEFTMGLRTEAPLKAQFNISEPTDEDPHHSFIIFYLAPRVEDDDDFEYED